MGIDIHNDTQGEPIVPPGPAHTSPYNCTHSSELYGGEAARIIAAHDVATPLYMYLALQSTHCPDQAPQDLIDKFKDVKHYGRRVMCGMVITLDNAVRRAFPSWNRSILTEIYLCHACSCHEILRMEMPGQVSMAVEALHAHRMYDNTFIIFHSDNGGELNNAGSNLPMRGGKFTYWEGGTRVNSLISGGVIPAKARGTHYDGLLAVVDW
jgi:hypothetical protein